MPIPKPTPSESEKEFIDRCMSELTEYDTSQRYAICQSQYVKNNIAQKINKKLKKIVAVSYDDYPEAASNNAKRALKYRDESGNPKGCGTPVGWKRANQLANREPISRDTIARMAAFERHRQNKDVPYKEGCGGLMWDAWGGTEGVEWAQRKLKQIDNEAN